MLWLETEFNFVTLGFFCFMTWRKSSRRQKLFPTVLPSALQPIHLHSFVFLSRQQPCLIYLYVSLCNFSSSILNNFILSSLCLYFPHETCHPFHFLPLSVPSIFLPASYFFLILNIFLVAFIHHLLTSYSFSMVGVFIDQRWANPSGWMDPNTEKGCPLCPWAEALLDLFV